MLTLAAGFSVQVADLRAVAATFAQLHDDAVDLLDAASGALAGTGGMAGHDPVLAPWRGRYDAIANAHWAAAATAVNVLGAIATKLEATADTYLAADHAATPGASGPSDRGGSPAARVFTAPAAPPSSAGAAGPSVTDVLAEYYPDGDPASLRAAASAWLGWADGMNHVALTGDRAFQALLATGDGTTFSAMRTFWARQFVPSGTEPLLNAVVDAAGTLGKAGADLAALIDRTRAATRNAATEAVHDMSPLELPAALLSEVAWGVPELELLIGTVALAASYLDESRAAYFFFLDRLVEQLDVANEQRLRRVAVPPAPEAPIGVGLADVGRITGLELTGTRWDAVVGPHPTPDTIHIAPDVVTHVLAGDRRGGGHAAGAGKPGKNEFPPAWTDQHIIAAALDVARSPDTVTAARIKDRWVVAGLRNGVQIRVIVGGDGSLTTAIPWSGPGVITNPD